MIISSHAVNPPVGQMGGKAKNLHFLSRHGIAVPRWFCLSVAGFEAFIATYQTTISKIISTIDFDSYQSIQTAAETIQKFFVDAPFPVGLREAIQQTLAADLKGAKFMSVRSSALSEDSGKDSFAGQMDTFLYVSEAELEKHIRLCWASAFGAKVLTYTNARGIDPLANRVSVVIQEMFDSDVSGVLFTVNPSGILHEMLIVGGYGIGEGIVSDQVETDSFVYHRFEKRIDKDVRLKETRLDRGPTGGTQTNPVLNGAGPCLSDAQIQILVDTALQIEKLYGQPQDIEWGVDKLGALAILQARPITTLPMGEKVMFDNSNISESYPGITLPLTFSFIKLGYEGVFRPAAVRCGARPEQLVEASATFKNLVGMINGRVYMNLGNWYSMFRTIPGTSKFLQVWEESLGISVRSAAPGKARLHEILKMSREYIRVGTHLIHNYFTVVPDMDRLHANFDRASKDFKKLPLKTMSPQALVGVFFAMRERVFAGWEVTLINDMFTFIFSALTKAILKKAGFANPTDVYNRILRGEAQPDSVKPVLSILALARFVRGNPELSRKLSRQLDETDFDTSFQKLMDEQTEFNKAFMEHTEEYGDRAQGELKLETLTYREDPKALLALILSYANQEEMATDSHAEKNRAAKAKVESELKVQFRGKPLLRMAFNFVLVKARTYIMYRENSRLDRSRVYGIVRTIFRELGRQLQKSRAIDAVDDIFYLSEEEVVTWIQGSSVNSELKSLINARKAQYTTYAELPPMDRMHVQGFIYQMKIFDRPMEKDTSELGESSLTGTACAAGIVEAQACIVLDPAKAPSTKGKILIAEMTDPGWVFLMLTAAGLISEKGSILSHTAIIGRELGIPTIVGVKNATRRIPQGAFIHMDGENGHVKIATPAESLKKSS